MGLDNISRIIDAKKEQMGIDTPQGVVKQEVSNEVLEALKLMAKYLQTGLEEISGRLDTMEHNQRVINLEISKVKKKLEIED